MYSAQNKLYKSIATPLFGVAVLLFSSTSVMAADTTIGEFLYNDSYAPDITATCVLNVKNPDATNYLVNYALVTSSDGWYGHTFTSPTTAGYYRSEICCDTGGDHMCIDKSFSVNPEPVSGSALTSSDIAAAVWGYSGRTLTGFNNIVSDVWGYATRTLTSDTSTVNSNLTSLTKTTNETRLLVEQLVNKPIISNSFEEFKDFNLIGKIKDGQRISDGLYTNILLAQSSIDNTSKNWNKLSTTEIVDAINDVKFILGEESDSSSSDTLFGRVNFLRDSFGYKEADLIYQDIQAVRDSLNFTQTTVAVDNTKSTSLLKEFSSGSAYLKSSEKSLGLINKRLKEAEGLSTLIDTNLNETNNVLGVWNSMNEDEKNNKVDDITKSALSINRLPKIANVLSSVYENIAGDKKLKNKILSIRAILFANKKLLATGSKDVQLTNWLEEGSLVIKTLITNPSTLISQTVPLKYYLPKELKKEDVIETDAGINVQYDTDQDQLYVEGSFILRPAETKTIKVRVEDVWTIRESEIDALKAQSDNLIKPLEKTSFYAQGITLKSDIDISLEKAKGLVKDGTTPESKIKSFREAQLELISAKEKLDKMKDMVSQANSSGSILGFVGGSQAIAVWGVVIAIVTSFVFMTLYMKRLMGVKENKKTVPATYRTSNFDKLAVFLVVATISGLLSSMGVKEFVIPTVRANTRTEVLGTTTVDYRELKIVELSSVNGVVKTYENEGTETVAEIADSGKSAVEVERGEKRVRVVFDQKEAWVAIENVLNK